MTRDKSARSGAPSRVLIFGESSNDTAAIRELAAALRPSLAGRLKTLRTPVVLIRDAKPSDVPSRAEKITAAVNAARVRGPVCGVLLHEDCDDFEPADDPIAAKMEAALSHLGLEVHAVVPAWELEAWWFLWPEAVAAVRSSWRTPDAYVGRRVGLIQNAKEELARAVISDTSSSRGRGYCESDSVQIAKHVRAMGIADAPKGQSASYERFRLRLAQCSA